MTHDCVVDDDVDRVEGGDPCGYHSLDLLMPAQIRGVIDRANAVMIFDLAAKRCDVTAPIESAQHEIAAGGREAVRRGQAEATHGSRDEGILASEWAHAKGCYSAARVCGGFWRKSQREIRPVPLSNDAADITNTSES